MCLYVCRQLGAELHQLTPALPLFDGVTGQAVHKATDSRVERLRDVLMDDARERVDDLGQDLVAGLPQASCAAPQHVSAGSKDAVVLKSQQHLCTCSALWRSCGCHWLAMAQKPVNIIAEVFQRLTDLWYRAHEEFFLCSAIAPPRSTPLLC